MKNASISISSSSSDTLIKLILRVKRTISLNTSQSTGVSESILLPSAQPLPLKKP